MKLISDRVGPYRINKFLGEGGMGRVYMAHHGVLERPTALKFMPDELVKKPGWVERFCAEARTLAKLDHRNVVRVYGAEADIRENRCYLEIEYVDGGDLEERLQKSRTGLPEIELRRMMKETLEALAYAHSKNIIHRDLKPANILLRKDGTVKISDFGLASVVGEEYHRSLIQKSITLSQLNQAETMQAHAPSMLSAVGGTLPYMSPQAKAGEPPDPRDDIFAVGVMTYYLLTAKLPDYDTTPLRSLRPDILPGWEGFFRRCIAREREKRFQTAEEALEALDNLEQGQLPKRWYWVALAALVLVVGGVVWQRSGREGSASALELKLQKIEFRGATEPVYIDSKIPLDARASSLLPVTFQVVSGAAKIERGVLTFSTLGKVVVRASQAGSDEYQRAQPVDVGFEVLSAPSDVRPQEIRWTAMPERVPADAVLTPELTSSSGLPVMLEVVSGPAEIVAGQLRMKGNKGEVVVRATQAGGEGFLPAEPVERRILVERAYPKSLRIVLPDNVPLVLVLVPKGKVNLGPLEAELGATINDAKREVYLAAEPFYLSRTEVTQSQYKAITGTNPSFHNRAQPDTCPVEQIRYEDLMRKGGFVDRLNAHFRAQQLPWVASLPTEQEWEYACRAGTDSPLYDGSALTGVSREPALDRLAIYGDRKSPSTVATKEPNAWGLYDMLGNVAEWTAEGHLRGGSFRDGASALRAAARLRDARNLKDAYGRFGFRIVLRSIDP